MAGEEAEVGFPFWELAGAAVNLIQLALFYAGIDKYADRLEEMADDSVERGNERYDNYRILRDRDPEFSAYYEALPDYEVCESNVKRSKGAAYARYGDKLRGAIKQNRGFTPLTKIYSTYTLANQPVFESAGHMAVTRSQERSRVDNHVLQRWQAIISEPVEKGGIGSSSTALNASFSSLKQFTTGFNSAGIALGTQIFRLQNHGNSTK